MANIKKSFNFRNGVQVDDDNLKVSATGLVGIGTTVPTEALDVRGNLVVSGVSSAVTAQAGVLTVTTLNPTEIIGAGVSIKSGIVTASSGIITYFGDGINLLNLPTSQWVDTIVGLGVSSIYNAGGNVGIATTAALFTLQIGNDVNSSGQKGVGISSFGDIKASGIATASGFVGPLTGNVTGNLTGNVSSDTVVSGIATFSKDLDVDGHTNLDNVSVAGVTSFTGATNHDGGATVDIHLDVIGLTTLDDVNVSSGATFAGSIDANGDLDVTGVSTFSGDIVTGAGATVGIGTTVFFGTNKKAIFNDNLQIFAGNDGVIRHTKTGPYSLSLETAGAVYVGTVELAETIAAFRQTSVDLYHSNQVKFQTSGVGVTVYNQLDTTNIVASSTITAAEQLNTPICGIGTDAPAHDIQVRKSGAAEIQVTSDTGTAGITVGREPAGGKTNNAELRYGAEAGSDYNTAQSLDIINYGTDNFNYYLSANNPGGVTGNYFWHKGLNNVRLMTLTNTGRLGIGITAPTDELHVIGGATVSGDVAVGNNLTVSGTVIGNVQGQLTGNVAGTLAGNTNTTVGISTLNNLSVAGVGTIARIRTNNFAIGENPATIASDVVSIKTSDTNKIIINDLGQVGIAVTEHFPNISINAFTSNLIIGQIGVGVTQFNSGSVDFSSPGPASRRYVNLPRVSTALRGNLTGLISGAMIYNTSINKLQFYNGSAWETVTSST